MVGWWSSGYMRLWGNPFVPNDGRDRVRHRLIWNPMCAVVNQMAPWTEAPDQERVGSPEPEPSVVQIGLQNQIDERLANCVYSQDHKSEPQTHQAKGAVNHSPPHWMLWNSRQLAHINPLNFRQEVSFQGSRSIPTCDTGNFKKDGILT